MENYGDRKGPQKLDEGTRKAGNLWTCRDHPNYSIIKIPQNTKKRPGDLRRPAVTQTPVSNHQLTLKPKTLKECKNNNNTNKRYMHNSAPVLENDTHKLLWDFSIHTDHLILVRRPDLIIINKKKKKKENLQNSRLCCPG